VKASSLSADEPQRLSDVLAQEYESLGRCRSGPATGYGSSRTFGTRVRLREPFAVTSATSSMRTPPRPR